MVSSGNLGIYEFLNHFYYIEGTITLKNGLDPNSYISIAKISKCIPTYSQAIYCPNMSGGKYYSGYLSINDDGNIYMVNTGNVSTYFYTIISSFYRK